MFGLAGYQLTEKRRDQGRFTYFKAIPEKGGEPLLVKVLARALPSAEEAASFRHEYELMQGLATEGVPRVLDFIRHDKTYALLMEFCEGIFLHDLLAKKGESALPLSDILALVSRLTDILGQLHQHQIIHKNICPANILWDRRKGRVHLLDFGIASKSSRDTPDLFRADLPTGLPLYSSPEQSGRMNRPIDYRTDFYSLGATFYHLLTGKPPFDGADPLALVHAHIAKAPAAPHLLRPDLPVVLSEIVGKLIAKPVEERYQSTFGLRADLEKCREWLTSGGTIQPFEIGQKDISNRFLVSQKLYGRDKELAVLLESFERTADGNGQVVMVSGYSGVGKTTLIRELYRPVTRRRGYFISGKYEQFERDFPYAALIKALREMVRHLLTETQSRLERWRERLLTALQPNGRVVLDVIPDLELLIGKQPPVAPLSPLESENRFNLVFQNLLKAIATEEHPLVLFLDDLQWVDLPTMKLLEGYLTDPESRYLFLVGSYRDNEVAEDHPLRLMLKGLVSKMLPVHHLRLKPLRPKHVCQIVADTAGQRPDEVEPLAELCYNKTEGNPFFLGQFLQALHENRLITFDESRGSWHWDMDQLQKTLITENVVELMVAKILKLPQPTRQSLMLAACIGNRFDLKTLSLVRNATPRQTAEELQVAVAEGLLTIQNVSPGESGSLENIAYNFLHDRIQQAAFSLLDQDEKKAIRLRLGRLMLKEFGEEATSDFLFVIVNHLNYGRDLMEDADELDRLSDLNLAAGKKAKSSAAYGAAVSYMEIGISLLPSDSWENSYERALALHLEAVEASYLNQQPDRVNALSEVVLAQARDLLDKVKVYDILLQATWSNQKAQEALGLGLRVLAMLGVHFPEHPTQEDIEKGLHALLEQLDPFEDGQLLSLPEMTDPHKLAAMRLISRILTISFMADYRLFPLLIFKMVLLSLKHGNTALTAMAYVVFGVCLCGMTRDFDAADRFGKLSLRLVDRFDAKDLKGNVNYTYLCNIFHWKHHLAETIDPLRHAYQAALSVGDFEFAGYALHSYGYVQFLTCKIKLSQLDEDIESMIQRIVKLKLENLLPFFTTFRQLVDNLLGRAEHPTRLHGASFDRDTEMPILEKNGDHTALSYLYFHELMLCYHLGDVQTAFDRAEQLESHMFNVLAGPVMPLFHFYLSLARLAVLPEVQGSARDAILKRVEESLQTLKSLSNHAPMNHHHRGLIVEAEMLRIRGEELKAIEHYQNAALLAARHQYLAEEALCHELTAGLWLKRGQDDLAHHYAEKAYRLYDFWGAAAKVSYLGKRFPNLSKQDIADELDMSPSELQLTGGNLDLISLFKASQVISGEIVLSELLRKLMHLLIQNAGAQRGVLLLKRHEAFLVKARGNVDGALEYVEEDLALENSGEVAQTIVTYVSKTKESVLLDEAIRDRRFSQDPYIRQHQPQSLLCMPILNQGGLIGVLYLENNRNSGAFTSRHLKLLQLLSAQAAISIVNASLYANLEQEVEERTRQVQVKNKQIVSSIQCAERIQSAILPEIHQIKRSFAESFVLYRPKDIVSGDFYWFSHRPGAMFLAVVDCTGHGVPGGFMSMIGNTLLNQIINEEGQEDPAKILASLHTSIRAALKQENEAMGTTEGMDMVLCRLDQEGGELVFAGAMRPLFLVEETGAGELPVLREFKGDRRSIGGRQRERLREFHNHHVALTPGLTMYLTSDGFVDQPDAHGRKYGSRLFKNLLVTLARLDMEEQERVLAGELQRHQGETLQRDDITVVGVRLT